MSRPTCVQEIEKSLEERKKAKAYIDSCFTLSDGSKNLIELSSKGNYEEKGPTRLLDEGAILYEGGEEIRLYIEKGCIQNFYDNLSDDFVGYINLGHIDINSLPICLGTWTKSDLNIVDIGDGRKGLDCNVHLNEELHIVQDLRAQSIPLSVSVEMTGEYDNQATFTYGAPFLSAIDIKGFSVVGNPANVTSANANLSNKGEEDMSLKDLLGLNSEEAPKTEEVVEETVESVEELESKEETAPETTETLENEETVGEVSDEMNLSEDDVDALTSFADKFKEIQEELENLKSENEELRAQLEEAKQHNQEQTKLKADVSEVLNRLSNLTNATLKEERLSSQPKQPENMWK